MLTVQVGGSSSSGLQRDAAGREISTNSSTTRVDHAHDTESGVQVQGNSELQVWAQDPQNSQRIRMRSKQHERVDHRQALGQEPLLRPEDREDARVAEPDDWCAEEVPAMRGRAVQRRLGQQEGEKHELTHLPYRPWCKSCVRGRGLVLAHRPRAGLEEELRRTQKVAMDWAFFRDDDHGDLTNVLVVIDRETGQRFGLQAVNRHANDAGLISQVAIHLKRIGHHGNLEVQIDGEPALVELTENVAAQRDAPTVVVRTSPGDSEGNGLVERAVRSLEEATRVLKLDLEERAGGRISVHDPVFAWLLRHASMASTGSRRGEMDSPRMNASGGECTGARLCCLAQRSCTGD